MTATLPCPRALAAPPQFPLVPLSLAAGFHIAVHPHKADVPRGKMPIIAVKAIPVHNFLKSPLSTPTLPVSPPTSPTGGNCLLYYLIHCRALFDSLCSVSWFPRARHLFIYLFFSLQRLRIYSCSVFCVPVSSQTLSIYSFLARASYLLSVSAQFIEYLVCRRSSQCSCDKFIQLRSPKLKLVHNKCKKRPKRTDRLQASE